MIVLATLAVMLGQGPSSLGGRVPLDSAWELSGAGSRIGTYQGRRAILLGSGRAIHRGIVLQDGTIDADLFLRPLRSFAYLQFRMQSEGDHEEIYLRTHKSRLPDAIQYTPVWNGESNWQLYHGPGFTADPAIPTGTWTHLRLVLNGRRAALFIGDTVRPVMVMTLQRDAKAGYLALRSFVARGESAGTEPAVAFANIEVRPGMTNYRFPPPPPPPSPPARPEGLVTAWQLSRPFAAKPGPVLRVPDSLLAGRDAWPAYPTEPNGMVVIDRHLVRPDPDAAVIARLVVEAAEAGWKRLDLGFSDYVTVFVKGRPVFAGDAHFSVDGPRQDGVIGLWQGSVWIPVEPGPNEVLLAVADGFGGWGLMARWAP